MAYYLQSESSAALISSPSPEAATAKIFGKSIQMSLATTAVFFVDLNAVSVSDIVEYSLIVKVFYLYLNRRSRHLSNLNRLRSVKTHTQRVKTKPSTI